MESTTRTGLPPDRRRRFVGLVVVLALLTGGLGAYVLRDRIREAWLLHRLAGDDAPVRAEAARRLGDCGGAGGRQPIPGTRHVWTLRMSADGRRAVMLRWHGEGESRRGAVHIVDLPERRGERTP